MKRIFVLAFMCILALCLLTSCGIDLSQPLNGGDKPSPTPAEPADGTQIDDPDGDGEQIDDPNGSVEIPPQPVDPDELSDIISEKFVMVTLPSGETVCLHFIIMPSGEIFCDYGTYNNYRCYFQWNEDTAITELEVGGYKFYYPSSAKWIISDGKTQLSLAQAYENKLISLQDLAAIYNCHQQFCQAQQKNGGNSTLVDLTLDDDVAATIKQDFWNCTHRTPSDDVQQNVIILAFYGKYVNNGKTSYVMMITATDLLYTEALVDYTVAGVDFHFNNGNTIRVYTLDEMGEHKFISLPEAYEAHLLTAADIQTIADIRNGNYCDDSEDIESPCIMPIALDRQK